MEQIKNINLIEKEGILEGFTYKPEMWKNPIKLTEEQLQ